MPERISRRITHPPSTGPGANQDDVMDMNALVAQYRKHGTMPAVSHRNPLYGDFTFPEDIHQIREAGLIAEDRFSRLPADVRTAANNDWVTFLEMFEDPNQKTLLIEAGLEVGAPPPNNSPDPTNPTGDPTPPTNPPTPPNPDPDPIPPTS